MINFKRDSDNLVVAGNGPSLKNIDLNSLPSNFDVFRCNQFYPHRGGPASAVRQTIPLSVTS